MLWNVYSRDGKVYVPTVAQTEAGFYLDIEPVFVAEVSDGAAIRHAVESAIEKGNAIMPTPSRAAFPKPAVLKHTTLKSWSAFERGAAYWKIVEGAGRYRVIVGRKNVLGGWEDDPEKSTSISRNAIVDHILRHVWDAANTDKGKHR